MLEHKLRDSVQLRQQEGEKRDTQRLEGPRCLPAVSPLGSTRHMLPGLVPQLPPTEPAEWGGRGAEGFPTVLSAPQQVREQSPPESGQEVVTGGKGRA